MSDPVSSATVVLLRDGVEGLEIYMVRRHTDFGEFGGTYTFPSGKVGAADRSWLDLLDQTATRLLDAWHESGLDAVATAALHMAAVRQAFEETGLL